MLTNDELRQLDNLKLFGMLFGVQEEIIEFWRNIPPQKFPSEEQALELANKEVYAMRIAEILIERGKLPKGWGR